MAITLDGTTGINTSGTLVATGSLTTSSSLTTGTGAIYNGLQSSTVVTASGATVDFTNLPSWVKRVTVMYHNLLSTAAGNGTEFLLQLGTGATPTYTTTGYNASSGIYYNNNLTLVNAYATGFPISNPSTSFPVSGSCVFTLLSSSTNTWTAIGASSFGSANNRTGSNGGSVALSATLTAVRFSVPTTTFVSGTINIIYE